MIAEQLLTSFLQSNSLSALVESVSILFDGPVIVVDEAFRIAAAFAANGYDDPDYRTAVSHSQLSFEAAAKISGSSEEIGKDFFCFAHKDKIYQVVALHTGEVMTGYMILVKGNSDSGISPSYESDMAFAAALVSKQLCLERHSPASSTAEELLITLLSGEFQDEEHFRLKSSSTFLSGFHPRCFALVAVTREKNVHAADDVLRRSFASNFHGSYPFFYRDRIVMFLHEEQDSKRLEDMAGNEGLCVVLSPRLESVFAMGRMYRTVSDVLDYLLLRGRKGILVQSRKYAMLMALRGIEDPESMILPEIKEMGEYDGKNLSELCLTLYYYLICHHSLAETCERLYTHRNTVLYRMKKIKEDFGLVPELPENHGKYLLSCALLLLKAGHEDLFVD